jgi:hypothetical protein
LGTKEVRLGITVVFVYALEASMCVLWSTNSRRELESYSISNTVLVENFFQRWSKAPACRSFRSKEKL